MASQRKTAGAKKPARAVTGARKKAAKRTSRTAAGSGAVRRRREETKASAPMSLGTLSRARVTQDVPPPAPTQAPATARARSRDVREVDTDTAALIKPMGTLSAGLTRAAAPATLAVEREGLSPDTATHIVRAAADGYAGSIEATLQAIGLLSANRLELFRLGVRDGVRDAGYEIALSVIPNAATTRLSAVRSAIVAGAH
jgi:hypothetical protein